MEPLKNLQTKIANETYILYEALVTVVIEEDCGIHALETAYNYVTSLENMAIKARLTGLPAICQQLCQNLVELPALDLEQRKALCAEIERWPRLISNYLYLPTDPVTHNQLINYLKNAQWSQPCSNEQAVQIIDSLNKDIINLKIKSQPVKITDLFSGDFPLSENSKEVTEHQSASSINNTEEEMREEAIQSTSVELTKLENEMRKEAIQSTSSVELTQLDNQIPEKSTTQSTNVEMTDLFGETAEKISQPTRAKLTDFNVELLKESSKNVQQPTNHSKNKKIQEDTDTVENLGNKSQQDSEDSLFEFLNTELTELDAELLNEAPYKQQSLENSSNNNEESQQNEVGDTNISAPTLWVPFGTPEYQVLVKLFNKIVEMSDTLSIALKQIMTLDSEDENFFEGINQYTNTVQSFWELSEKIGLKGLQEICIFVNDNVFELSSLSQSERVRRQKQFTLWPQRILDYLQMASPGIQPLMELLRLKSWPIAMSDDQANDLLSRLIQDCSSQVVVETSKPNDKPSEEEVSKQNNKLISTSDSSPPLVSRDEVETDESESLNIPDISESESEIGAAWIAENVNIGDSWEFKESSWLDEPEEDEPEEDDDGNSIFEPSYPASSETKTTLDNISTYNDSRDMQNFERKNEENNDLEEEVNVELDEQDDENPIPSFLVPQKEVIAKKLSTEEMELTEESEEEELRIANEEIVSDETQLTSGEKELVITEKFNDNNVEQAKEIAVTDELSGEELMTDTEELPLTDEIELPVSNELFDDELVTEELPLTDLDLVFTEELLLTDEIELPALQELPNDEVELSTMEELPTEVELETTELLSIDDTGIPTPEELLDNEGIPNNEKLATTDENESTDIKRNTEDLTLPDKLPSKKELPKVEKSLHKSNTEELTLPDELSSEEELPKVEKSLHEKMENKDNENLEETSHQLELTAKEVQKIPKESAQPILVELASPDIIDLLVGQINDVAESLNKTLDHLIKAEDFSEILLEAVESYTENVQAIWDAAEMAALGGLQEVCTFINDNIMALSGEPISARSKVNEPLAIWPQCVVMYLQTPVKGTDTLLNLMQRTEWPAPLDNEAASLLRQHLLPTIDTAKTDAILIVEDEKNQIEENKKPEIILLADPDILDLLIGQINDVAESLNQTLDHLIKAEDFSETLLEAVESYTENVQAIWDAGEMAALGGLQEVCTFINDNIMALSGEPISARSKVHEPLAIWPQCVVAYLQSPGEGTDTLLNLMQRTEWPAPLDNEAASQLRQHLLPVTDTVQTDIAPVVDSDNQIQENKKEKIVLADPDILELLIGQINDVAESLNQTLEQFIKAEDGSEILLEAVESYTENVQAIWDAAEMAALDGLQEVCTFINDNVMVLSGEPISKREQIYDILATWPLLVVAYLQNPDQETTALVDLLQSTYWPTHIDNAAAELLQNNLTKRHQEQPNIEVPAETTISLAAPDILELVCAQITEVAEELSAVLEVCVSMENENPAFLEAIEDYTNKVQDIWDAADMAGLSGLQEICTFVNDNLMAFSMQDQATKLVTQTYFKQWPTKVLEYLQSPVSGAPHLVAFVQEPGWPIPLAENIASHLLILLTKSSDKADIQESVEENPAETTQKTVEIEEKETSSVSEMTPLKMEESGDISLGSAEVVEILTSELDFAKEDLAKELNKFTTLTNTEAGFEEASENYTENVQRLNMAAEMMSLEGLQAVCTFIVDNVTLLKSQDLAARKKAKKVLEKWPNSILGYLQSPNDNVVPLVNHFREPQWAQALTDDAAYTLLKQLTAGSTAEESEEEVDQRQTQASPDDVLLTIPEDINPELLEAYLQEAPQHAQDFSTSIQNIIQENETSEIEKAQRIAHTLKGSSNIIGIKGIANIAHHLEDTLEYLAKHQVVPPKELTDTMIEAADCLEIMVDALLGQDEPPPQALQVLQAVLDWANRIDKGKLDAPPAQSRPTPVQESAPVPTTDKPKAASKSETKQKQGGGDAATPEQFLRVPTKTVDDLMRLVGELSISVGQIQERLKHVMHDTRSLTEQNLELQQKTFELENLVDIRGITGVENRHKRANVNEQDEDFDPLEFEEYNELHSVAHSFIESIADNRELGMSIREDLGELETMFIHQERLNKEFQANIMTTRMVPVSTVVAKVQRNIRQTCRMTGKKAELEVTGTDILIDSDVLNNLGDPLQHILRNSVDHGLEATDERILLGKPEAGTIKLSFYREGNNIVVSCQDDGQGLNYTNIRFTAVQRGLITENQELSEKELARLILTSGFSTKSGVTQVSGRGVGMDVVHTNIRQMKGTLDILSETGKGTTMLIKLPMTLVTVHVLLVRVGNLRFGIPTSTLEQALAPGVGDFHKIGDEITLKKGKDFYALKYLADLLNMQGDKNGLEDYETRPIILVHDETGITAVIVDELLDTHDLVMKNMGKYVTKIHGVAGASILGNGSLVPLLDAPELLRSQMQTAMSSYINEQQPDGEVMQAAAAPCVMIVDDSLSVRKSLSLLVEEAGFETLLAKDGLEAIEIMHEKRPNVMLVDMEMPRMNGLELTAHVRANQNTQNLPIFMITSRTTEKHRQQAQTAGVSAYLTKPYQEVELLGLIDKALAG
ncbi:hybrid sensor histidine kinase/response regulator [Candidatus Parabeggiatoa sp. HSG14]|uniref:hybrid sensor histidine kinase/response regulator n=1 Tax=Candidatus Parabeggiatoa sp. HSG14 TaxID=3055593 RepID=UPI0025A7D7B0|nr:hybrid sensor histidine kinase/response regulator [Thiotrichales bacterium HSG14]